MNTEKKYSNKDGRLCVIYEMYNKINYKRYIGKNVYYKDRWINHKNLLNKRLHDNYLLQKDWNLFGSSNFEFKIIKEDIYLNQIY